MDIISESITQKTSNLLFEKSVEQGKMYVIHLTFVHNFTLFKMNVILKRCEFLYTFSPLF